MGYQENKITIQSLLVLAIIFSILSMVLPMNGIAEENEDTVIDVYLWGMHNTVDDEWNVYLQPSDSAEDSVDSTSDSDVELPSEMIVLIILTLLMLTILPICIIAMIIGLFAIRNIGRKKSRLSLVSAIMIIFSFIVEIAFIMSMVGLINKYTNVEIVINWSFGSVFLIISFVLFLMSYIMQLSLYSPVGVGYTQQQYQPGYQIPQQQPYQQSYQPYPPPQQPYYKQSSSLESFDELFCPNCHKRIDRDMIFCGECGYKLK